MPKKALINLKPPAGLTPCENGTIICGAQVEIPIKALPKISHTIKIGLERSFAKYNLLSSGDMIDLLKKMAGSR